MFSIQQMSASDIKDLFSINIKKRTDSITDQYNRIFMVKILLASTVIIGLSWYYDNLNCIFPTPQQGGNMIAFISQTCWIQGVYIYREMSSKTSDSAYFGIPKNLDHDGLVQGHLCSTSDPYYGINDICKPMEPTYFLQYQWMPFYVCALTFFYYLPYLFHKHFNYDLISLKSDIKDKNISSEKIFTFYFEEHANGKRVKYSRIIANVLIKVGYLMINVIAFLFTNSFLEGYFLSYGIEWIFWSRLPNAIQFDYKGKRTSPKPGNRILPAFGFCEVYSSAKDRKHSFGDKHKLVCEVSQFVLYQYIFLILWFTMIMGMIISVAGIILQMVHYIYKIGIRYGKFKHLSFRQCEYLEYVRVRHPILYGEIMIKLKERHPYSNHNGNAIEVPLYEERNEAASNSYH